MRWTCPKCGKEGQVDGNNIQITWHKTAPIYACPCGARWYDQPIDIEIDGVPFKAGRWEETDEGGWIPEGTIPVVDEREITGKENRTWLQDSAMRYYPVGTIPVIAERHVT
jgi:hypothetical protein